MALVRTALGTQQGKPSANFVITLAAAVAAGDLVVLLVAGDVAAAANTRIETAAGGNQQNFPAADVTATNSGNVVTQIYSLISASAYSAGDQIKVVSGSSGSALAAAAIKITGHASSPFDASSAGTGSGTSPSSGATGTLAQADEICIGAIGTEGPPTDAAGTWSNSFNAGQRDGSDTAGAASNVTISEGYLIVSATTAQTAAKTGVGSRDWAAAIATYKGAAAALSPPFDPILQAVKRASLY